MSDIIKANPEMQELMSVDSYPIVSVDKDLSVGHITYSFAEIASLGSVFSALPAALAPVLSSKQSGQLYRVIFPKGVSGELLRKKDGDLIGTIVDKGSFTGQAILKEAGTKDVVGMMSQSSMLFMALALTAVTKTLENVLEAQQEIIGFLEADKQSKLKADLLTLTDIMSNYKYNWNNAQFKANRDMQLLDIKRDAEANIIFYRDRIRARFDAKESFIHIETEKVFNDLYSIFRYYQLALYLFAYSSFLEIMLLENFDSAYLQSIEGRINKYAEEYNSFYQECNAKLERYVNTSVQSVLLKGTSIAHKAVGEAIAKTKLGKTQIDEFFIDNGTKLQDVRNRMNDKLLQAFSANEQSGIDLFMRNIETVDRLYNKQTELLFDQDNIYLNVE